MEIIPYQEFLKETGLCKQFKECIKNEKESGKLKKISYNKFMEGSCKRAEEYLFKILEPVDDIEFPDVELKSPNMPILMLFKWLLINIEREKKDEGISNEKDTRIGRL